MSSGTHSTTQSYASAHALVLSPSFAFYCHLSPPGGRMSRPHRYKFVHAQMYTGYIWFYSIIRCLLLLLLYYCLASSPNAYYISIYFFYSIQLNSFWSKRPFGNKIRSFCVRHLAIYHPNRIPSNEIETIREWFPHLFPVMCSNTKLNIDLSEKCSRVARFATDWQFFSDVYVYKTLHIIYCIWALYADPQFPNAPTGHTSKSHFIWHWSSFNTG